MSLATDEELVRRIRLGDLFAYGDLVRRYQGLVFGVAFHQLSNVEDAKDVAQDVFIRAFVRIGQVRDISCIGSWLRQIVINECRAWFVKNRRVDTLMEEGHVVNPIGDTDDRLLVATALNSIDEASRLTVILFYLHAYSMKEIGSFLDEPVTTIKSRLRNARAKLRRELEDVLERNLSKEPLPGDFSERIKRLIEAAQSGDTATVRALIERDPRLLSPDEAPGRHTPLHVAASSGNAAVVELLLAHGSDPNALDVGDNASPLHYAAERGWLEVVKLLVEAGADVNFDRDLHEGGPLGWAVIFGQVQWEVAEYLVAHGARFNIFTATALGREDVVREIVEQDPEALRRQMSEWELRRSPIEFATSRKEFEIAHLLVSLGAEVTLRDAAALGDLERLRTFLGAKPEREELNRAVKAAVQANRIETTRVLLEYGADPDATFEGTSLVFDALASNDGDLARVLLSFGADLEFRDSQWNSTAIGWEVFFGRPQGVQLALDLGAKVDPHLLELAQSGERGELRRFSSGTPVGYRQVAQLLRDHKP